MTTHGRCAEGFEEVAAEFERNFVERDELGASVCVIHDGRTVVDLWGGTSDAATGSSWQQDTMVVVFSCTKAAAALCAHVLATHGELDLDDSVGRYWPAFGREGRQAITVRMLLNHQAGLPGVSKPLDVGALCDFDAMVGLMERETPLWRPGSRHGYHAITFGWLVGEVIRRVAGETVGTFFRRNVAGPLGIDFWIGLPGSEEQRVATTVMSDDGEATFAPRLAEAIQNREPIQLELVNSIASLLTPGACDAPGVHAAEIPAANGITNARGLAGMYAPLSVGGQLDGVTLVDGEQLAQMGSTESAGEDAVMFEACRFSPGFEKAAGGRAVFLGAEGLLLSEAAFGHSGLGGSVGFADPQGRFAFGYTMNRHARPGEAQTARSQPLIDATYRCVGYRSPDSGKWARW
jgi:CubicO group peptidase (beta-lactamase class C family)